MSESTKVNKELSIAVVGMGYWGKNLVRNFHRTGALRAVCDDAVQIKEVLRSQYPDVEYVPDYDLLLQDSNIHGIALATPAATHYEMAKKALEAGKDVFVEKPLALRVEHGEDLVNLAVHSERILMVGHILQYHSAVIKLKELINRGELGDLHYIYSNRLNMGKIRTEENILWSFAPHDISVMLSLLEADPIEVSSTGGSYVSKDIVDVTMSQFVFPGNVRGHIFVSWLHPFKEQKLVVVGSDKMAVFDDTVEHKLVLYPHRVDWKEGVPTAVKAGGEIVELDATEPLYAECTHFLDCMKERTQPITDGKEGLRVLKVLHACQTSLEK